MVLALLIRFILGLQLVCYYTKAVPAKSHFSTGLQDVETWDSEPFQVTEDWRGVSAVDTLLMEGRDYDQEKDASPVLYIPPPPPSPPPPPQSAASKYRRPAANLYRSRFPAPVGQSQPAPPPQSVAPPPQSVPPPPPPPSSASQCGSAADCVRTVGKGYICSKKNKKCIYCPYDPWGTNSFWVRGLLAECNRKLDP